MASALEASQCPFLEPLSRLSTGLASWRGVDHNAVDDMNKSRMVKEFFNSQHGRADMAVLSLFRLCSLHDACKRQKGPTQLCSEVFSSACLKLVQTWGHPVPRDIVMSPPLPCHEIPSVTDGEIP